MTRKLFSTVMLSLIVLFGFAQFDFTLSKSLSDNFTEEFVTVAEADGKVYMYDYSKETIVLFDVEKDSYIKTPDKFFEEAGAASPNNYYNKAFALNDDYLVMAYVSTKAYKKVAATFFFLIYDKEDLSFIKKLEFNAEGKALQAYANVLFEFSENGKHLLTEYEEIYGIVYTSSPTTRYKLSRLDIEAGEFTSYEQLDEINDDPNKNNEYLTDYKVSNDGTLFALKVKNPADRSEEKFQKLSMVKVAADGEMKTQEIEDEEIEKSYELAYDQNRKELHLMVFSNYDNDKEDQNRIYDTYSYYKLDEDLNILVSEEEEALDEEMILEANQKIEFNKVEDNSIGLISFIFKDLVLLDGKPVVVLEHKVRFKNGTFYPSFLLMFLDEKGSLDGHVLVKRWNSDGGDGFGAELSLSRIYTSKDAIYILANFNTRFEPFKDEKEFEKTAFAYIKIGADGDIAYHNILSFSEANYFGITKNLRSYPINDGNIVYKLQREPKGNIPAEFKAYKYFFATTKLK